MNLETMIINHLAVVVLCSVTVVRSSSEPFPDLNGTDSDQTSTVHLEGFWDVRNQPLMRTAVQAGDSVTFVCRVWQLVPARESHLDGSTMDDDVFRQSVYLYCPMSVAYCSQDCLLVDSDWPMQCTKQVRKVFDVHHVPKLLRYQQAKHWRLQEIFYTLNIATIGSSGSWSCSYGGFQSANAELRVRDRPTLLSFTSTPRSPVLVGSPVNLTCRAAHSPNSPWYNFVWRRLGTRIPPAHSTLRLSDTVSVLLLTSAQATDDGRYRCHVVWDSDQSGSHLWPDALRPRNRKLNIREDGFNNSMFEGNETQLNKHDPAVLYLDLHVYHPPSSLTFTIEPDEPHMVRSIVTLVCQVNGGKPVPEIKFYRLLGTNATTIDNAKGIEYFNSTNAQPQPAVESTRIRLKLRVTEVEHEVRFGCSATSPVISGKMLSKPKEMLVLFPPGPPILTAIPHGAVSENRTRVFMCRASRGSFPVARVRWKLLAAMDYAPMMLSKAQAVGPLQQTTNSMIHPGTDTTDFNIDEELKLFDRSHLKDPENRGYIAVSEARLISRPWFNGARVSCQLEWSSDKIGEVKGMNDGSSDRSEMETNQVNYSLPVSLTTEVLFAPSAISLSVNPLNGIQENSGEQTLECTTTSSFPTAKIAWLRQEQSHGERLSEEKNVAELTGYSTLGIPLENSDFYVPVKENVTFEVLPGLYGGKRVVSRLKLKNFTREDDGTTYMCKVTHIEWIQPYGRIHTVVVLYPPQLRIEPWPEALRDRITSPKAKLKCVPEGGRPIIRNLPTDSSKLQNRSYHRVDQNFLWKFTWLFRPAYPSNLWAHGQIRPLESYFNLVDKVQNLSRIEIKDNHATVLLDHPGRQFAGEYVCLLEGPGGTVRTSIDMQFSFPPELIPSGQTAFTAPVGNSAVLELFIWAYPSPVPTSKMHESYSTPIRMNRCGESIDVTHNAEGISYIWYKVNPEGTASTLLVSSRVSENQFPVDGSRSPIWSDVILVNLASIFTQQVYALPVNREGQGQDKQKDNITSTPVPIPTLVYRLIFDQVHEFDYGEYICEIEHWSGKRTFLTKLQPPVASSVPVKNVKFSRTGSVIVLHFDPNIMKSTDGSVTIRPSNTATVPPADVKSTSAHLRSNQDDGKPSFVWMLIRICVLVEPYDTRQANNSESKKSSCPENFKAEFIQIQPNLCVNRVIPNPESGTATLRLDTSNNPNPGHEPTLAAEEQVDQAKSVWKIQFANFPIDSNSPSIRWERVRRVAYQLRFYDSQGRLAHHTSWVYEDVGNSQSVSASNSTLHKSVVLPAAFLLTLLAVLFLSAIPLLFLLRKRKRKHELETNMNSGCLSLKNPLNDTPLEFFQTTNTKRENFYVANASVVDSPCTLLCRPDQVGRRTLTKNGPGISNDSDENFCSPHGSFQLIPNVAFKTNAICLLEKTADGRVILADRSISPTYTPVLRRGSAGNSPELTSFYKAQMTHAPQNHRFTNRNSEHSMNRNENKLMSNSTSHYSNESHTSETSRSPLQSSPLFIYNKCYPGESDTQPHCISQIRSCLSTIPGMTNGSSFSPNMKMTSALGRQPLSSLRTDQNMYLSGFHCPTTNTDILHVDHCPSPYLLTRFPHPIGIPLRQTGRPVCASQLMQRRELTTKDDLIKYTYDTGSLKIPCHVQPVNNGKTNSSLESSHICPMRTLTDSHSSQPNAAITAESASPNSSEMDVSEELIRVNALPRRSRTNGTRLGNRPVGTINDILLEKHIREALLNSPIQTDQNTEEEVSSRTPYDNELLEQDEELDPMEAC